MNILHVASEGTPFCKTGGLADVIGALPAELAKLGHDVRVIMPKHEHIPDEFTGRMELVQHFQFHVGWRNQYCGLLQLELDGITYYFVDNEYYFKREGIYGYDDDPERYAYFCRAVLEGLPLLDFQPDILHCHDWQTGMIPVFLQAHYRPLPFFERLRTVYTIHNLRYQGIFSPLILHDLLHLADDFFSYDKIEYYGNINFMKGGLVYADQLTTVSPTYAEEIQYPYFGEGMHDVIAGRKDDLHGILNGLDRKRYDPLKDPHIFQRYRSSVKKKQENKVKLQEELGLPVGADIPLLAMVTRLDEQKGLDLVQAVLDDILATGAQFVILGTGEHRYEEFFKAAAQHHPQQVSTHTVFDDGLARKMYAASDLFLMPSKYEPCGLGQLIALRYGSLPIVRETGGLKDTVQAYEEETGQGNGFSFTNYNAHDMLYTIKRALDLYHHQPDVWSKIVQQACRSKFGWTESAKEYGRLYKQLTSEEEKLVKHE
jgi:starch synthase